MQVKIQITLSCHEKYSGKITKHIANIILVSSVGIYVGCDL